MFLVSGRLYLGPQTVLNHVSYVFAKPRAAGRARTMARAREAGLG